MEFAEKVLAQNISKLAFGTLVLMFLAGCSKPPVEDLAAGEESSTTAGSMSREVFSTRLSSDRLVGITFTPDGDSAYFMKTNKDGASEGIYWSSREAGGDWATPQLAGFSGSYADHDPFVSPDGQRLFFTSNRPLVPGGEAGGSDIWMVELRQGPEWSEPRSLGQPVNSSRYEAFPTIAADGTLYFGSNRDVASGEEGGSIYRAPEVADGVWGEPEPLDAEVNFGAGEWHAWIAPDQSYLIFTSHGGPGSYGQDDLYVSFQREGQWSRGRTLGPTVNRAGFEICPSVAPDGQFLYYSSNHEELGAAIYRVALEPLLSELTTSMEGDDHD